MELSMWLICLCTLIHRLSAYWILILHTIHHMGRWYKSHESLSSMDEKYSPWKSRAIQQLRVTSYYLWGIQVRANMVTKFSQSSNRRLTSISKWNIEPRFCSRLSDKTMLLQFQLCTVAMFFVLFFSNCSLAYSEVLHPNQEKTDAVLLLRCMYVLVCGFVRRCVFLSCVVKNSATLKKWEPIFCSAYK